MSSEVDSAEFPSSLYSAWSRRASDFAIDDDADACLANLPEYYTGEHLPVSRAHEQIIYEQLSFMRNDFRRYRHSRSPLYILTGKARCEVRLRD